MGNICRSPTAEGVLRSLNARLAPDLKLRIDSAGTHAYYHLGEAPDTRAQQAAVRHGYDISAQRSRMVTPQDFSDFDYVLAMDRDNLAHLQKLRHPASHARLQLLLDYAPDKIPDSVPDPYNGGATGFDKVLELVEQGCVGLLRQLCEIQGIPFSGILPLKQNARP